MKKIFLIASSVADTTFISPNDNKTLLGKSLSTFFMIGKPAFSNVPKILHKSRLIALFYANEFFDNFILANELCAQALRSLQTCVLVLMITSVENYFYD